MDAMFEAAIQRSEPIWKFIHQYQTFLAGWLTLIAGLFALAAAWAIVKEGKRQRAFKVKQREIDKQTKRRDVAMMLVVDIKSGFSTKDLASLMTQVEERIKVLKRLDDGEVSALPVFPCFYKSLLNNYSHYIENIPLMQSEAVIGVSQFYSDVVNLSEAFESSNAKSKGSANNETEINLIKHLADILNNTTDQGMRTMHVLAEEIEKAQKKLDRLKGVKEKPVASALSSFDTPPPAAVATQDEDEGEAPKKPSS